MILAAILCHDCHARHETGNGSEGSDALFRPLVEFDGKPVRCPRCQSDRVTVQLAPDEAKKPNP